MKRTYQQTIVEPLYFEGIGLHSGKKSKIKILPGDEKKGIVFKRIDLTRNNIIQANYKNVSSTNLSTTLQNNYGKIYLLK